MGLLSQQKEEKAKYIYATDFINLIAFTTKEVIDDIVSYLINNNFEKKIASYNIDRHIRITRHTHKDIFGFDGNTRDFLDDCYRSSFFFEYISYDSMSKIRSGFYYSIADLQSLDFINNLNLDMTSLSESKKAVDEWNKEQRNPIFRIGKSNFEKPNHYQMTIIKQDYFYTIDAACLLAGVSKDDVEMYKNHYKFTELYSDYISYQLMLDAALDKGLIEHFDFRISPDSLQRYLYDIGYIIRGFNDWLTIEPAKPLNKNNSNNELREAHNKIAELEQQLTDERAINSFGMMGTPKVEGLEPKSKEQLIQELADANEKIANLESQLANTPADDKELAPNSQAGVARMLYAILIENGYDLSPTKGKGVANDMIVNAANNHGTSVTRNFVADWLIRAREAKINNTK